VGGSSSAHCPEAGLQGGFDLVPVEPHRVDGPLEQISDHPEHVHGVRLHHAHHHRGVGLRGVHLPQDHHEVTAAERLRQEPQGFAIELKLGQFGEVLGTVRHEASYPREGACE
jgi:hypothetical protein